VKGIWNGDPASICQWSNDKSGSGTHVLITVVENSTDLLDLAIAAISSFILPIVPQLLHPLEIVSRLYIHLLELFNNITSMYIGGDEGNDDFTLKICEITSNEFSQMIQLCYIQIEPFL
jgi:hypothetical protein